MTKGINMRSWIAVVIAGAFMPSLHAAQAGDISIDPDKDEESNPQVQCEKWAKQDGVVGTPDYELYMDDCLTRFTVPEEDIVIEEAAPPDVVTDIPPT